MEPAIDPNKFVLQRRHHRLQGICNLMVEYSVTLQDLEKFFMEQYETQDAIVERKRNKQNKKPIRQAIARNANKTRWDRYNTLRESNVVAKEAARERIAKVKQPDFSFADAKVTEPEGAETPLEIVEPYETSGKIHEEPEAELVKAAPRSSRKKVGQ